LPLVCDRRMRNVWESLLRRRNGTFMYPASASVPVNAEERQAAAMAELFYYAIWAVRLPGTVTTHNKAEQKRNQFLAKAEELRADAEKWLRDAPADTAFGLFSNKSGPDECARRLMDASQAYKEIAAETYTAEMRTAVDRARGDADVRWFALAVADKCRSLFGSPMYGLTATITSVVHGRNVAPRTVRQWCHPAHKARKKST